MFRQKKEIPAMTLTPGQIEKLRTYLRKTAELRGYDYVEYPAILHCMVGTYENIEKYGDGDPIKAAEYIESLL